MLGVRKPLDVVRLPADEDGEETPNPWKANQPLHRGILGRKLVDECIGRCDLYFDVVMKLAVCLQEMSISFWQDHLMEPGSSLLGVETFVVRKLHGMLG